MGIEASYVGKCEDECNGTNTYYVTVTKTYEMTLSAKNKTEAEEMALEELDEHDLTDTSVDIE